MPLQFRLVTGQNDAVHRRSPAITVVPTDSSKPFVKSAVDYLFATSPQVHGVYDNSSRLFVFPGSRAIRRFQELASREAVSRSVPLFLPTMITVGVFPEWCLEQLSVEARTTAGLLPNPAADEREELESLFLALQQLTPDQRKVLLGATQLESVVQGMPVLKRLRNVWQDVAATGESAEKLLQQIPLESEESRWQVLFAVFAKAVEYLQGLGISHRGTERLKGLQLAELPLPATVTMVGCIDMPPVVRRYLQRVATEVIALVPGEQQLFSSEGEILPQAYRGKGARLDPKKIVIAQTPQEVVCAVRGKIPDGTSIEQVTIAVPDESYRPVVRALAGFAVHNSEGQPFDREPIAKLLQLKAKIHQDGSLQSFYELALSPYGRVAFGVEDAQVFQALQRQLLEFTYGRLVRRYGDCPSAEVRQWCQRAIDFLGKSTGDALLEAQQFEQLLERCGESPELRLAVRNQLLAVVPSAQRLVRTGMLQSSEIASFLTQALDAVTLPDVATQAAEMVGYLELLFDDAPQVIVLGATEGCLPENTSDDAFIPHQLRQAWGLSSNEKRFARDVHVLQVVHDSRPQLIVGISRTTVRGEALLPSRVLIGAELFEQPAMLHALYTDPGESVGAAVAVPLQLHQVPDPASLFRGKLAASSLKTFLYSPVKYYLEHLLKVRWPAVNPVELEHATIGSFAHKVLEVVINQDRQGTDLSRMHTLLRDIFAIQQQEFFGTNVRGTVQFQLDSLLVRLLAVMEREVARRREGYSTIATEVSVALPITVDGQQYTIEGRIDRIDKHAATGELQVIDYKTGTMTAKDIYALKTERWIDPQLPLYAAFVSQQHPGSRVGMALCRIDEKEVFVDCEDLALPAIYSSALECAQMVVKDILENRCFSLGELASSDPVYPLAKLLSERCLKEVA